MRKKIVTLLAILIIVPVGLISWLGWRMASNEQQLVTHRLQTLIQAQLTSIDQKILSHLERMKQKLLTDANTLQQDAQALRQYIRNSPYIRQLFVMDAEGQRLHPSLNISLNQQERQFLDRTEEIWRDKSILYYATMDGDKAPQPNTTGPNNKISPPSPSMEQSEIEQNIQKPTKKITTEKLKPILEELGSRRILKKQTTQESGWYTWYWGDEMNVILWWRNNRDQLVGFELEPARLKADIIGMLPDVNDPSLIDARVKLMDSRDHVIYQWGAYSPEEKTNAISASALSYPLNGWQLQYYAKDVAMTTSYTWFNIAIAIFVILIALTGLAIYLYREHMRQHRLAEQRVNFVNQVSHELKTPLTNIRMYAELLQDRLSLENHPQGDKTIDYVDVITTESERLSRLIANVLNFARAQKQKLKLRFSTGVVDDLIRVTIATFEPALTNKNVKINFQAGAKQEVDFDHDVVEQILNNLLGNVEKYGFTGEKLEITSEQQGNNVTIYIKDYGPGIPKREQKKIFQDFYRVSSKLSDGITGTGIGLSIAKQLAQLHGGDLNIESTEVGACFKVTLKTK